MYKCQDNMSRWSMSKNERRLKTSKNEKREFKNS